MLLLPLKEDSMASTYEAVMELQRERSKQRSAEREKLLKTPPAHHMMFLDVPATELVLLLRRLLKQTITETRCTEIYEQTARRGGPLPRSDHFEDLTREALLKLIYAILAPELERIDNAPVNDLPLLINETWSCPQLTERVKWRLSNDR
jgi:hypothetical protein